MNGTPHLPAFPDPDPTPPQTTTFDPNLFGHQLAWDSTSLGELKHCAKSYFYRVVCGYVPKGVTNAHLFFGQLVHSALEVYDHARAQGKTYEEACVAAVRAGLELSWDYKLNRPWESTETNKTRLTLVRTIVWYLDKFKDDPAKTVILANGRPAVELSFRFECGLYSGLNDQPYLICGHIDRLVEFHDDFWIVDRKTTKHDIDEKYIAQFTPDNQVTLYNSAGQVILHKPVRGMLIDAIQVGVNFNRYQRFPVTRNKLQINEWLGDLEIWLRIAENYARLGHWPQNDKHCFNCPYRRVCSVAESARALELRDHYTISKWDPLIPRGE